MGAGNARNSVKASPTTAHVLLFLLARYPPMSFLPAPWSRRHRHHGFAPSNATTTELWGSPGTRMPIAKSIARRALSAAHRRTMRTSIDQDCARLQRSWLLGPWPRWPPKTGSHKGCPLSTSLRSTPGSRCFKRHPDTRLPWRGVKVSSTCGRRESW